MRRGKSAANRSRKKRGGRELLDCGFSQKLHRNGRKGKNIACQERGEREGKVVRYKPDFFCAFLRFFWEGEIAPLNF